MKKYSNSILLPLLLLVTFGCETIIDVDLPKHEPTLVLNSFFGTDTTFIVSLHQNKDILDNSNDFKGISGATIALYTGDHLIGEFFESVDQSGYYELNIYPEEGVDYTIRAARQGFEPIESHDIIPAGKSSPSIDKLVTKKDSYGEMVYEMTYSLDDPSGSDYYEVLLFTYSPQYEYYADEDTSYQKLIGYWKESIYYSEAGAELNEFEDIGDPTIFSDDLFDGKRHSNAIEFYYYAYEDSGPEDNQRKFTLEVRHVSQAYYRYRVSLQLQQDTDGNPFAEAAPVYNNVENGYGIFAGYSVETVEFK